MPSQAIKNFAKKSGKSKEEVETLYRKAKGIVKEQYPKVEAESDKFYELVMGVLKKMLKLQGEDMSTGSVGVNPGGNGAHQVRMFTLSPEEIECEEKKRKKVLEYIKNYK